MSVISKLKKLLAGAVFTSIAMAGSTHAATSNSDILFILDGSGSMWGQIEGVAKIQTAKQTMTKLLDNVPEAARLGLMTYGTRDKQSCQDYVVLNGLGADRSSIKNSIAGIKPLGKTPIASSLLWGIGVLGASEPADSQKSIVLVSDGIETCDNDPCAVATTSQFAGVAMNIHVVGFDVDAEARTQLECIAKNGNGQYFNASDTDGFEKAMQAVVEVAQAETKPEPAPEPVVEEPKEPVITEFFRDDFDGEELGEIWAIENPNPDAFIVEGGVLTMLSTSDGGMAAQEPENLISYTGEMPKGDWDVNITYTGDYASASDRLQLGLRKDGKNFMAASYISKYAVGSSCYYTTVDLDKASSGKTDNISQNFRSSPGQHCRSTTELEPWEKIRADHQENPLTLTLSKRGRAYLTTVKMADYNDADGNQVVLTTDKFTSLRSPGELGFTIDRAYAPIRTLEGEVLMSIDSFVINTVEK